MSPLTRSIFSACAVVMLAAALIVPVHAQKKGAIISLNKASVQELMAIPTLRIPDGLAKAIVDYRTANGPFKKPEDLRKVPGMTDDFLQDLNPQLRDGDVVYDPDAEPAMAPSKC